MRASSVVSENSADSPVFTVWLKAQRGAALRRGGKAWTSRQLADLKREQRAGLSQRLYVADRKAGEIVNRVTGEIVTGCRTFHALAKELQVTTAKLTDAATRLGVVHRILGSKEIRSRVNTATNKTVYFRTPAATPFGVSNGHIIPVTSELGKSGDGLRRTMLLITPDGQTLIREALAASAEKPKKRTEVRRSAVNKMLSRGASAAEIIRETGIPRRTVYRLIGETIGLE